MERLIKSGLESIIDGLRRTFIAELVQLLRGEFRDNLVSVVIFGSVARNQAKIDSDTDILVVSSAFDRSMTTRMNRLVKVLERLEDTEPFREMERRGVNA